jgi:hypothetical protein
MSEASDLQLDPTMQDVFDFLRRYPGEAFSGKAIAQQIGDADEDVQAAISALQARGLVDERSSATGEPTYIVSPSAPNL